MPNNRINILFDAYLICILKALTMPKRYSDLSSECPNENTRIKKLRALESAGLVETAALRKNGRIFVHYKLTQKGEEVLKLLKKFETL